MTDTDKREKIATGLCTNFFNEQARRSAGFRDTLSKQVERVLEVADALDGVPITYDVLNEVHADGVILEGLTALGLVDVFTRKRWGERMARFHEAIAAAFPADAPPDAKVCEVLTEQDAVAIWMATA
jgi:hypothetical protein